MWITLAILLYISLLFIVAFATKGKQENADFFVGGRRSPWWSVAFGMVGASISGVTFVSVPGWVTAIHFSYMQMVLGFIVGYLMIAYLLLPLYYRSNQTTIYSLLENNLGIYGRKTAALCFLFNKFFSSAVKHYVVVFVLHTIVFEPMGIPFWVVAFSSILIVWLYSFRSGIRTIVWTDFLQTASLLCALLLLIHTACRLLGCDWSEAIQIVHRSELSNWWVWDFNSKQNFFKQFISGAFVVLVMTGMDQDLMQKNLSCKTLKEAQKNMISYGVLFVPLNLLLLSLGVLVVEYYQTKCGGQLAMDALSLTGDRLLPTFAQEAGGIAVGCFAIGMLASSFSSIDSAMTSITTSVVTDLRKREPSKKERTITHVCVAFILFLLVMGLKNIHNDHAIDVVYKIVSYLYGPLLGLFGFALLTHKKRAGRRILAFAFISILLSHTISSALLNYCNYSMGYELLLINGLIMFTLLSLPARNNK